MPTPNFHLTQYPCVYCGYYYPAYQTIHDHCSDAECRRQCGECAQERAEDMWEGIAKEKNIKLYNMTQEVKLWDED